jgi:phenylalanyl-tRNA synthetase alpha chain
MMDNNLEIYNSEIDNFTTTTLEELDAFRLKYLGKKGILIDLFNKIKDIPPENRNTPFNNK